MKHRISVTRDNKSQCHKTGKLGGLMQCSDGQVRDELDSVRAEKVRSGGRGGEGAVGQNGGR